MPAIVDLLKNWFGRSTVGGPSPHLSEEERRRWEGGGFAVFPRFFSSQVIDDANARLEGLWKSAADQSRQTVADIYIGTEKERRVRLKDAPLAARHEPHKINDLFLEEDFIRDLVLERRLASILGEFLQGPPLVCNSLNLAFGSQQEFHTDSLYMTPPKDLNLVATWIALEDCHPDAGPLKYYPGSHKIPPYQFSHGRITAVPAEMPGYRAHMSAWIERLGLVPETFCAGKGDLFIWHSQLYHGGSPINDKTRTRRSLITHYFKLGDAPCDAADFGGGRFYMVRPPQPVP